MAILCSETLRLREHREQLAKEPRGIQGEWQKSTAYDMYYIDKH